MERPENHCNFCPQDELVEHTTFGDEPEILIKGPQNYLLLLWCNSCGALGEIRVEEGKRVSWKWHAPTNPRPVEKTMDIGGVDHIIETEHPAAAIDYAVQAIRKRWPDCVFEDAITSEKFDYKGQLSFGHHEELLIYQDAEARELWEKEGLVSYNQYARPQPVRQTVGKMVHLLRGKDSIGLAYDEGTEIESVVPEIRKGLQEGAFNP